MKEATGRGLPHEVAELLSPRTLAIRDLDAALVLAGIEAVEFLDSQSAPLVEAAAMTTDQNPCARALRLLMRVRQAVVRGATSWATVRSHLAERLEREAES